MSSGDYIVQLVSDDPANIGDAVELFNFSDAEDSAAFVPSHMDVDQTTGRIVVIGRGGAINNYPLRIIYSDSGGLAWTEAVIPWLEMGAALGSSDVEKVQHLGGGRWIARFNEASGSQAALTRNWFVSVDGGVNWEIAEVSNYTETEYIGIPYDFDFNGSVMRGLDYGNSYMVEGARQ